MPLKLGPKNWVVIFHGVPVEHAPLTGERIPRMGDEGSAMLMCKMLENEFELARQG
jgi:hypothetical protein